MDRAHPKPADLHRTTDKKSLREMGAGQCVPYVIQMAFVKLS